mmetsp:Transcript_28152/g.81389  ORF Transcript_28152/g.81389 Transcript_28152/m.81389 type:complete len:292 (+) Transcript_28152:93-968(+)|eukprot:CAMPEP_0181049118 /NCGR_PEP_ID=MMETSP1070-20121207/15799_1 /TAXON_ID=265543 /ORGANISM="Minutocellus polymorphus, Strain NH13" /LENGTH=291 /DNA_ID=CAMNT_0023127949 /DNA_START=9 /DNA_END=884 /DNA_ORIENTATION=+
MNPVPMTEGSKDVDECGDAECRKHIAQTQRWTQRIPIDLGLCPWAGKSMRLDRLRIIVCNGTSSINVGAFLCDEAQQLCEATTPEWSTTLVVCPHVAEWQDEFDSFDRYVQTFKAEQKYILKSDESNPNESNMLEQLTFVAFHPNFTRWHDLPKDIGFGSVVHSHRGMCGFEKSVKPSLANIIETDGCNFGKRKVKVQFENDGKEQFVPTDWLISDEDGNPLPKGEPLPDNAMHRAPHPTIHLIRNADLASLCARDVSRVKRKNAQLLSRLGWDGIQEKRQGECCADSVAC